MSSNNSGNPPIAGAIEYPVADVQPVADQPRQPQDLQGLLRFAMEVRQEGAEANVNLPMDRERRRFLEEALSSMTVDMAALVRRAITTLTDPQQTAGLALDDELSAEVKSAFHSLENVVDDIDIANDFAKMGGFEVFRVCFGVRNQDLWALACNLLAEVCQNNPFCQRHAVETGLLPVLLQRLNDPETLNLDKFVYAISCSIREYEPGCREFLSAGGLPALVGLLGAALAGERAPEGARLKAKTPLLIKHLCQHYEPAREILKELELPSVIANEIRHNASDTLAIEHLLLLLKTYLEHSTPDMLRQCRAPTLNLKQVIEDLMSLPHIIDRADENRETIEYSKAILRMLSKDYDPNLVCDCEDEADR